MIESQEVEARGLKSALISRGFTHVHYCLTVSEARGVIAEKNFQVVLLARTLEDCDGVGFAIELRRLLPKAVIVMLALDTPWSLAQEVESHGANALISKSIPISNLVDALLDLSQHPERFILIGNRMDGNRIAVNRMDELTLSEREILNHLSSGSTTREIAQQRHSSEATIKSHLTSIYRKLGVRNRVEAIALLHR